MFKIKVPADLISPKASPTASLVLLALCHSAQCLFLFLQNCYEKWDLNEIVIYCFFEAQIREEVREIFSI